MDQAFIFSGAGTNRKTLKQLYGQDLDDVIDTLAQTIPSGKNVTLDSDTTIAFYAFIPHWTSDKLSSFSVLVIPVPG